MERLYCWCALLFAAAVSSTLAGTEECGLVNANQQRDAHVKIAHIDEFPWMGRLAYGNVSGVETVFLCQAVLITERYLITVAHCLGQLRNLEPYAVLLGDWSTDKNWTDVDCEQLSGKCSTPLMIEIDEIVVHAHFDWNKHINDIGLLRLVQSVTYSDFIRPICLPQKEDEMKQYDSKELTLTGWLNRSRGFRQKKIVPIFTLNECSRIYTSRQEGLNVTETHLCGIVCEDRDGFLSSSALMDVKNEESQSSRAYLVGLVSYRTLTCPDGVPDIFTRVDRYLDWIKNNIDT